MKTHETLDETGGRGRAQAPGAKARSRQSASWQPGSVRVGKDRSALEEQRLGGKRKIEEEVKDEGNVPL